MGRIIPGFLLRRWIVAGLFGFLAASFIYYYIFQIPGVISRTYIGISAILGLVGATGAFFLWPRVNKTYRSFVPSQRREAFLLTLVVTNCGFVLFLFAGELPLENLLIPQSIIEIKSQSPFTSPLEIRWLNSGLADISFQQLQVESGETEILQNGILIRPFRQPAEGQAVADQAVTVKWQGRAWGQIAIEFSTGPDQSSILLIVNGHPEEIDLRRSVPGTLGVTRAVFSPWMAYLPAALITYGFLFLTSLGLSIVGLRLLIGADRDTVVPIADWPGRQAGPERPAQAQAAVPELVFLIPGLIAVLGFALIAYIGWFNRYLYDDYCYAANAREMGVFGCLSWNLVNTNGRFSQMTLLCLMEAIQPVGFRLSVAIVQGLLFASIVVLLKQVFPKTSSPNILRLVAFGGGIYLVTMTAIPHIAHTIIWYSGMVTVVPSLVLFNITLAVLLNRSFDRRGVKLPDYLALVFCPFLALGFNETIAAVTIGLSVLFLFFSFWPVLQIPAVARRLLLVTLGGAISGFSLMVSLPGTSARFASYEHPGSLVDIVRIALESAFAARNIFAGPEGLFLFMSVILVGILAGWLSRKGFSPGLTREQLLGWSGLMFLVGLAAFVGAFLPGAYAINKSIPLRTMIIPAYCLILGSFLCGYFLGLAIRQFFFGWNVYLLIPMFAIIAWIFLVRYLPLQAIYAQYALGWDQRLERIEQALAAGQDDIIVEPILGGGLIGDIKPLASYWVNRCATSYFGIHVRLRAEDSDSASSP